MKNTIRRISCSVLAVAMMAGTLCVANATSSKRNNVGNSNTYKSTFHMDLGYRTDSLLGVKNNNVTTNHDIYCSGTTCHVVPYNNRDKRNYITYYALSKTSEDNTITNCGYNSCEDVKFKFSEKMESWDKDIIYIRVIVSPYFGNSSLSKTAKSMCSRRASTNITH